MHRLYGTYLIYLVEKTLRETATPLSAKEIAITINEMPSIREQQNLEARIRRVLRWFEGDELLLKEKHRISKNIVCYKYKLVEHEQKSEIS